MKYGIFKIVFPVVFFLFSLLTVAQNKEVSEKYAIIPYPALLNLQAGKFTIDAYTSLVIDNLFQKEAGYLQELIKNGTGISLKESGKATTNVIFFKHDVTLKDSEEYRLEILPEKMLLSAGSPVGMFRAIQTVRQLLPDFIENKGNKARQLTLPALTINDKPAYSWRGMELDVSRHFFSVSYLKKFIDVMALYKFNKLHLHLTDDQGWRIEIKKYPELTAQGAWRTFNNQDSVCMEKAKSNPDFIIDPKHIIQKDGKILYGGFYSQEEMKEVIAYASARYIEIIPEIDMPGHMMAAINSFPFLSCNGNSSWGELFSVPVCPCKETTYQFAENVFSEIAALFPSQYIHLGADEVEKTTWAKSALCKELMQKEGLKSVDELQSYFVKRMEKFFISKGKKLIGWDEILEGGISSTATIMYWRSWVPDAPAKAVKNGNQVIMTPNTYLYFDYQPDKNSLFNVYHIDFTPKGISESEAKLILGGQANIWTEVIPNEKRADYMYMPRMTALAEKLWTNQDLFKSYEKRISQQFARLDRLNIHYRLPDLTGFTQESVFINEAVLQVKKPLDYLTIRFTTDGTMPVITSAELKQSLPVHETQTIKLAAFTPSGSQGDIYTINYKKQTLAQPKVVSQPKNGIQCSYYKGFFKGTQKIPAGKADSLFIAKNLNVPKEINAPSFGLKYRGYLNIPESGIYSFYFLCDDGGVLRIAGRDVINNDGLHAAIEKSGQVALGKGLQDFEIDFVEGGGGFKLQLKYSKDGGEPKEIPDSWFNY